MMTLFAIPRALGVALTILLYFAVAEARLDSKTCAQPCAPDSGHGCAGACAVCDTVSRKCVGGKSKPAVTSAPVTTTKAPPATPAPSVPCQGVVKNTDCGEAYIHKAAEAYTGDYVGTLPQEQIELTGRVTGEEIYGNNKWYNHKGGFVAGACLESLSGGAEWCN